jgi:hypothetical protein
MFKQATMTQVATAQAQAEALAAELYGGASLQALVSSGEVMAQWVTVPSGDHQLLVWESTMAGAAVCWEPAALAEVTPAGVLRWMAE